MKTFKDFCDMNEQKEENKDIKGEFVIKNLARLINSLVGDRHFKKAKIKGQRENTKLIVHTQNGDILELTAKFLQNLNSA